MLVVGITGRSGSGKSSVAQYYASLGHPVADGDELSRTVCRPGTPCLRELAQAFGDDILAPDGSLKRRELGAKAYASPKGNQTLIAITHPHIFREMQRLEDEACKAGAPLFFIDGAMIVGSMFQPHCDRIVLVVSETKLSISRIILRDGISKAAANARLSAQLAEEALRAAADFIIENNGSPAGLHRRADEVLRQLLEEEAP